ncbi:UDENN domain-containing protein [Aphelenchoides besseyi]|nr:UDENN domain-containing protein [Aphelenchoides besseyi]KAI6201452.1 UDENN domain-containing protein [Aphelenchoides besseyi]
MHPILHVLVVGFHHTKGCQVEFCYPPFPNSKSAANPDTELPSEWINLPSLVMPDQSHSTESDTVYFTIPSLTNRNRTVFGIACYRQIDTQSLISKKNDVTRSYVQKSVCVLSTVPLFGMLKEKLQLITQSYFEEKDFSKVEVLQQMYANLADVFDTQSLDQQFAYMGVPLDSLLRIFKHRTLELLKLIMLEKKVIFELHPTGILSDVIIGLISLFPCMIESGLFESAVYSPSENENNEENAKAPANEHGFPLKIFTKRNLLFPYMSINGIDDLRNRNVRAYCIGVTNGIFKLNLDLYDVYVSMDQKGNGVIEYNDNELAQKLSLTTQDNRFMSNILKTVSDSSPAEFNGNDDWVAMQFYLYICAMFNAASKNDEHMAEYNLEFIRLWKETENYKEWSSKTYEKLSQIDSSHPSTGPISAQDFIALVGHQFHHFGRAHALPTLSTTARYLTEKSGKLRTTFSSWINRSTSRSSTSGDTSSKK